MLLSAAVPDVGEGQDSTSRSGPAATATVEAHRGYAAGGMHQFFLGANYRDLWTTPISVPVLDLRSYGGGLKPLKTGGGKQTVTLRLGAPDGREYVFRPVYKKLLDLPDEFKNTIIWSAIMDARSASHPVAPIAAPAIAKAAGLLRTTPILYMMPDDPLLGDFRKEFAGVLGTIEEQPNAEENKPHFAGAADIIDSDKLLQRINRNGNNRVDTRALVTARLVDMLLNDNDRHAGQWKWAQMPGRTDWVPIGRDRDKVFISYEGFLLDVARMGAPSLVTFDSTYPKSSALFDNAIEFDRRLLAGVERPVWDSIAAHLVRVITDDVLNEGVSAMPAAYVRARPEILAKLKVRRDQLPASAREYYLSLARVVDIHASDTTDRATISRSGEGVVDVAIQSGGEPPWFRRRFIAAETREVRVYLHGGDDFASVNGRANTSIPVRIIGGNGNNVLLDSSVVAGRRQPTHIYDLGAVSGVEYESDSITKLKAETDEGELPFDRRPWIEPFGSLIPPIRDNGARIAPVLGLGAEHALGLVPKIGFARYTYGFRHYPYASMMRAAVAYSPTTNRTEVTFNTDKRFESSRFHFTSAAAMSQFGVVEFRGFGNDVPDLTGDFYDVRQRQWSFHPAAALSLGSKSEVSLGPILRYTSTDSISNRFISLARPYGFGTFGQAGVRFSLTHDSRVVTLGRSRGGFRFAERTYQAFATKLDFTANAYPALFDTDGAYTDVAGVAAAYLTFPFGTKPMIAMRAGGKKLFGDFPYFDAAFVGGSQSLRTEYRQRYAGDASAYGSAELRVPVARFPLLLPLDVGLLGFADAARVYLDGESPGGWHTAMGGGIWVGILNPSTSMTVMLTNDRDRRVLVSMGMAF